MLAATATVTNDMRKDVISRLDMKQCEFVSASPNKPNTTYLVVRRTSIDEDMRYVVSDIRSNGINAERVIIYYRSLNMCSDLYAHFCMSYRRKVTIPLVQRKLVIIAFSACITLTLPSTTKKSFYVVWY